MQDFKHDLTSLGDAIVHWLTHSLVLSFLGIGMSIDFFQSCGLLVLLGLLVLPGLLTY